MLSWVCFPFRRDARERVDGLNEIAARVLNEKKCQYFEELPAFTTG